MPEKIKGALKFAGGVFKSFIADDCLNLAANISFCALLSLIPVAMMMVSIAGYFLGGSEDALRRIIEASTSVLPVGRDLFTANLTSITEQRSSLGLVGVGFLIFIATILVGAIERSLDAVFKMERRRNFFHSRLLGIALIFWVTLLFALPAMAQILEGLLEKYGFAFPLSEFMEGKAFFVVVAFLAYLMTVVIIPNGKVFTRYAILGGVFFSLGIGIAKFIFRSYMVFALTRYNIIYGSLTAVVIMVVWIYYLAVVLLLSAELVAALQSSRLLHKGFPKIVSGNK